MIQTCSVVGTGLAARAMTPALLRAGIEVKSVSGRNLERAREVVGDSSSVALLFPELALPADLILLCVTDTAIESVTAAISDSADISGTAILHMAGARGLQPLEAAARRSARIGKLHPIASLSGGSARLAGSVFGIAALEPELLAEIENLAERLGGTAVNVTHVDLRLYHLAAVFASNLTLGIIDSAVQLWNLSGAPLPAHEALLPLMRGMLDNWETIGIERALSGPIQRGDVQAVAQQAKALASDAPALEDVYRELSRVLTGVALRSQRAHERGIAEIARFLAEKTLLD